MPRESRRNFIGQAIGGGVAGALGVSAAAAWAADAAPSKSRQIYELSIYQLGKASPAAADDYFRQALLPAAGRAGVGPVGVFHEAGKGDPSNIYALIPYANIDAVLKFRALLAGDAEYQQAGKSFIAAPAKEPAYANHEARLMIAADFMPALAAPEKTPTREFELRRYRSPSEAAFRKKLEMFATAELAIFRRVGLNAVLFSEMLFGPDMFNITYMLCYADVEARKKAWSTFGQDPEWQKLRATAGYTDAEIIASIDSRTLKPTAYSQL